MEESGGEKHIGREKPTTEYQIHTKQARIYTMIQISKLRTACGHSSTHTIEKLRTRYTEKAIVSHHTETKREENYCHTQQFCGGSSKSAAMAHCDVSSAHIIGEVDGHE